MAKQGVLFPEKSVGFSDNAYCKFLRCFVCGVYLYRVDNEFGLYIGEVVPYTFLMGKPVCVGCYGNNGEL
jgi:hypothetical protein